MSQRNKIFLQYRLHLQYLKNRNFFLLTFSATFMFALAIYMSISLIFSLNLPNLVKYTLSAFLVLFSQSMIFTRSLVISHYKIPIPILYFLGAITCFFALLMVATLARDAIALLLLLFQNEMPILKNLLSFLTAPHTNMFIMGSMLIIAPLGMCKTLYSVRVHNVKTPIKNLPKPFYDMRIAHLSDLHIGSIFGKKWLKQIVDKTNKANADIVLITGDLVDGTPEFLFDTMSVLKELNAPLGVHIVSGNHEYYSGFEAWKQIWESWGFSVLVNEHKELRYKDIPFTLAGLPDKTVTQYNSTQKPDMEQALTGTHKENLKQAHMETFKQAKSEFTILMSHPPINAKQHAKLGVNLQLSGHTHAGQCFFIFPLTTWRNQGFRSGIYTIDAMTLHVSPGTGLWGYAPLRIGTQSEISILELSAYD